jgi:Fur family ferric uptake transcriptional regulator
MLIIAILLHFCYNLQQMDEAFTSLLRKNKLSNTLQRRTVFKVLALSKNALSMKELSIKAPTVDRVSIYRIIDQFEKAGIVHRIQLGWKYKIELGETFRAHHHHLTCIKCGRVIDFHENASFESILSELSAVHHFKPVQHTLEIRGYCELCQKNL